MHCTRDRFLVSLFLIVARVGSSAQDASLSPARLTFSSQAVDTTSAVQTLTLTNPHDTNALAISSIAASGMFTETNTCGSSLAAGGSCTITVRFAPTATGTIDGSISIFDNAPLSPQVVGLTGTGIAQEALSTNSFDFGTVTIGQTSEVETIKLTNHTAATIPEKPMQVPYFTRVLSLPNTESEEHFNGALLWITLSMIGSPQLEKIGWKLVEKMRLAFGETRPLGVAPGHWFRRDEFVELSAFLLPCFTFGWDAYLAPSGKDYFVHISHDEFWMVVTKTTAAHKEVMEQLKSFDPQPPHPRCLARFCRNNSPSKENGS